MKTLFESILDNEEEIIDNANDKAYDYINIEKSRKQGLEIFKKYFERLIFMRIKDDAKDMMLKNITKSKLDKIIIALDELGAKYEPKYYCQKQRSRYSGGTTYFAFDYNHVSYSIGDLIYYPSQKSLRIKFYNQNI